MFSLPGTPESRMTYEELCRHAEETENLTAMAMAEYVNELPTEQDIQTSCDHAEYQGAYDMWEKLSDTLQDVHDVLKTYAEELVKLGERPGDLERLIKALDAHLTTDCPKEVEPPAKAA